MSAPDLPLLLKRQLAEALRTGKLELAEELLQRLQEHEPLAVETRGSELELLVRRGEAERAHSLAAQLVTQFPASARIRHHAGRAAYRVRDYQEAVEQLRESERLSPHWTTRRWLGKAMTQLGRLDEAEALLSPLTERSVACRRDLGWLYERRGEPQRAEQCYRACLRSHPEDRIAKTRLLGLHASSMPPRDLVDEAEALRALGEPVPEEIAAQLVEAWLSLGLGGQARAFVAEATHRLGRRTLLSIAWNAHRLGAYDISFDLFAHVFEANLHNNKFMAALERAARNVERVPALVELYRAHSARVPALHGRIRRLGQQSD